MALQESVHDGGRPTTQVICIDNFFTGSKDNIKHLIGKPNFELMRCAHHGALAHAHHALSPPVYESCQAHIWLDTLAGLSLLPRSNVLPLMFTFRAAAQDMLCSRHHLRGCYRARPLFWPWW